MLVNSIALTKSGSYTYRLDQPGQVMDIQGRFKLTQDDRLDLTVNVIHEAPNTKANISLKATVDGQAQAVIKGNIVVEKSAWGTESFLEERVLLLSAKAKAEAVPDLEIKTNEVKCSHAATVGVIDEEQLFYLAARGVPEALAKKTIAEGFLL